jgi:gliding motility-associated lipoprotein GldD
MQKAPRNYSNLFLFHLSLALIISVFFISCQNSYTPRPKGYYRITFPEKGYLVYNCYSCPFTFEYPVYANITRDERFFDTVPENPCWLNINFPDLTGTIYISYKQINKKNSLEKLIDDSHNLTFKHTVKADYIDETPIHNPYGVEGLFYEVGGNAASAVQFFLTDSTKNFIRGALYFNSVPNADSLRPVIAFVKTDMLHLINTFKWNNNKMPVNASSK